LAFISQGLNLRIGVLTEGAEDAFSGTVISRDRNSFSILASGSQHLPPQGTRVYAEGLREHLAIGFETAVRSSTDSPLPTLVLEIPRGVKTKSLRHSRRVAVMVPVRYRWYATCRKESRELEDGLLLDISTGGVALAAKEIPEDECLLALNFVLPGCPPMRSECRKCRVGPRGQTDYPFLVGLRFIMIEPGYRKGIKLFVSSRSGDD